MTRTAFIFLVLVNLLFLAWAQGYFGVPDEGHEPQRLARQLVPEKLRIVGVSAAGGRAPPESCRLIDGLAAEDAQRLRKEALDTVPGLSLASEPIEDPASYWVLIPPLPDRAAAEKKLAELKRLGVSGYQLVEEDGALKLAILLGAFKTQHAGSEFLQALGKRGVRSAKLQAREKTVMKAQLAGSVDSLDDALRAVLQGFPTAVLLPCAEK